MSLEHVISCFDIQTRWCDEMDAPFTAGILRAAIEDMREGGVVAKLIGDWPGNPIADALMMRFTGALHAAALTGRDADLARLYPDGNPNWSVEEIWPAARAFIEREFEWMRAFLQSPPQTNETRRAIALLPGFLALSGPLHLLEIGASAGLNQMWDKFRYETASWSWGQANGPRIDTDWRGLPPLDLDVAPVIASRAACDQNPLDVSNPDHVLRLNAYLWAEQRDRFPRLAAAIKAAQDAGVHVERADAADWLERKLAGPLPEGTTVLFHSVVWQYLPQEKRDAIEAIVEAASARADADHRLAWLRYEPLRLLGLDGQVDHMATELRLWPGAERRVLARGDGHARWVENVG